MGRALAMREVGKSLWVGDIGDAAAVLVLGGTKQGITHVLSMVDSEIPVKVQLTRKLVPIDDEEVENLLCRLEECLQFIEEAVRGGGTVLVHCYGGHSRSVSVAMAYLMRSEGISVQEALGYHQVNKGFLKQLHFFKAMGHAVNKEDPVYKELEAASVIFHDRVNNGLPWRKRLGVVCD